jgi:hypothetical protein
MVRMAALALLVMAAAQTANAQTTNCYTYGPNTTCRTLPRSGVDWSLLQQPVAPQPSIMESYALGQQIAAQRAQARAAQEQSDALAATQAGREKDQATLDLERDIRISVGKLVAAGQCDEARRTALFDGQLDLAKQVLDYCASAKAAP